MIEPREPITTVGYIDDYCLVYRSVFEDVRLYECFKLLHIGMLSSLPRKTLLDNPQNLHHFLTESPWTTQQLRQKRLELILKVVNGRPLILLIDETGDCKKGTSTDYVKRQYIGNVGKQEKGIVVITAYGLVELPSCGMVELLIKDYQACS